jgi:hypothetical protein
LVEKTDFPSSSSAVEGKSVRTNDLRESDNFPIHVPNATLKSFDSAAHSEVEIRGKFFVSVRVTQQQTILVITTSFLL